MKVELLKKGQRAVEIVSVITLVLALVKLSAGLISDSIVLISDAIHNIADLVAVIASWFGLRIAQRKPTERFPYGFYKIETLMAFLISIFILFAAYNLFTESYSKLFISSTLTLPSVALATSFVSIIISFLISKYEKRIGREINSQSLLTLAQESRIDIITSVGVFITLILVYLGLPYVEGIVGLAISVLIFKVGLENAYNALLSLLDVSPGKEIERKIEEIISSTHGVYGFENLKLRRAGPFVFGEVDIKVGKHLGITKVHDIADKIEERVRKEVPIIESFKIHVEPAEKVKLKIVIPVENKNDLKSKVSEHLGRAPYFMFITVDKNKVKSYYFKDNPYRHKQIRAGLTVAHELIKEDCDIVITRHVGEITFHTLRDHLIDVYLTKRKIVKGCIDDFVSKRLKRLLKPTKKIGEEKVEKERR